MQRHLETLKETGQIPPRYMVYLSRELGFPAVGHALLPWVLPILS
jgi:hypothetical protein